MTGAVTPVELFVYLNFVSDEEIQRKLFGTLDIQKPADVHTQLVTIWFQCPLACFIESSDPDHITKHKFQVKAFLLISILVAWMEQLVKYGWIQSTLTVQNC